MASSLAFLLGLGVGVLLHGGGDAAPARPDPGQPTQAEPPFEQPERIVVPGPVVAPAPARPLAELIDEALAKLPPPEVARGDGVIEGRVVDLDGAPLEGVRVLANPPAPPRAEREERPTAKALLDEARRALWIRANRRETRTGADGRFTLDDLSDVLYRVEARQDGYIIGSHKEPGRFALPRAELELALPPAELELVARPVTELLLDVVMPDGSQAPSAVIEVGGRTRSWTPADSKLWLEPGGYRLRARVGEMHASESVRVEIDKGGDRLAVEFEVVAQGGLRGRVAFPEDERDSRAVIRFRRLPASGDVDDAWLLAGRPAELKSGAFRVMHLEPGRYRVGVARSERLGFDAFADVDVAEGVADVALTVPPLPAFLVATLRPIGPEGDALTDVRVEFEYTSGAARSSGSGLFVRSSDGTVRVVPGHYGVRGERHVAHVISPRYGRRTVSFVPGAADPVEVRFERPGLVLVTVSGYAGSDLQGAIEVTLHQAETQEELLDLEHNEPGTGGRPDEDGSLTLGPVQPGPHVVVVAVPDGTRRVLSRSPVEVRSGNNAVTVKAPVSYSLTVVAPAGRRGHATLRSVRRHTQGYTGSRQIGADGKAVFPRLPPGEYEVGLFGGERRTIKVPETLEVRF